MLSILAAVAIAAPAKHAKCTYGSTTYYSTVTACDCLTTPNDDLDWFGTVKGRLAANIVGASTVAGTCYDAASWGYIHPDVDKQLTAHGYAAFSGLEESLYDGSAGHYEWDTYPSSQFTWETSGTCSIKAKYKSESISSNVVLIIDDELNVPVTEVHTGARQFSHIVSTDLNDDGLEDVSIVYHDGTVWDALAPFQMPDPVTEPLGPIP